MAFFQENLELAVAVDQSAWRLPITFTITANNRVDSVTGNPDERARPFYNRLKFFTVSCSNIGDQIAESVDIDNFPNQRARFPTWFVDRKRPNVVDHRTERRGWLILRQPRCSRRKEVSAVEGRASGFKPELFICQFSNFDLALL